MAQHPTEVPDGPPAKPRGAKTAAQPQAGAQGTTKSPELAAADVAAYLRRHPDFLINRPELLAVLAAPAREMGDGVVDLQRFMVERLRTDVARLKLVQRKLVATSRANLQNQTRVHSAVIAMLAATTFEHLITVVTEELTLLLDIDAVGLCIETAPAKARLGPNAAALAAGVQVLEPGSVDELIGTGHDVLLRSDVVGDAALFGAAAAGLVRSDALVRLKVSSAAPIGLLALGARKPGVFHPGQGTELLTFLAQVIEHSIRAWLDLPD
ncbi:MAG: DUF484 family protein [Proteobacteria bacterium]|nr:DUF484 family protein [Pseudomonadota bacterium]